MESYLAKGLPVSYVTNALGEKVPKVNPAAWNIHTGQPASGLTGVKHRTGAPTVDDATPAELIAPVEQWQQGALTLEQLQAVVAGARNGNGDGNQTGGLGGLLVAGLLLLLG